MQLTEQLDAQGFTREQRLLIDRLLCAYTENGAYYGRVTYKQGMKDCAVLLREMGLLKARGDVEGRKEPQ